MPSNNRCIFGCDTTGVTLHNFPHPVNSADIFKIWLEVIGEPIKKMAHLKIYHNKRVCDRHFTEKVKYQNGGLNSLAIPTLHLPNPPIIVCHKDSVQKNVQSTQQLSTGKNVPSTQQLSTGKNVPSTQQVSTGMVENGNEECNNDTFKLKGIGENKSVECESGKIASSSRMLKDMAVETDNVPSENQKQKTKIEVANEQFGSFVVRELETVPESKRQQVMKAIINLLKN